MINASGLASAVILRAYSDLVDPPMETKDRTYGAKQSRRRERWREDAREFLTVENPDLLFWCVVGGLNMQAIVEQTNRSLTKLKETEHAVSA